MRTKQKGDNHLYILWKGGTCRICDRNRYKEPSLWRKKKKRSFYLFNLMYLSQKSKLRSKTPCREQSRSRGKGLEDREIQLKLLADSMGYSTHRTFQTPECLYVTDADLPVPDRRIELIVTAREGLVWSGQHLAHNAQRQNAPAHSTQYFTATIEGKTISA